jgi:anti-anti-sigma regulatory factor
MLPFSTFWCIPGRNVIEFIPTVRLIGPVGESSLSVREMSEIRIEQVSASGFICHLSGYLERDLGEKLSEEVGKCLQAGGQIVVIAFARVTMINSLGVSGIIDAIEKIDTAGAELWLADVVGEIKPLLDVSGVLGLVPEILTSDEARTRLNS